MVGQIDKYHNLIDSLIELNRENRKLLSYDIKLMINKYQFVAEYCTVECDIGRGSGKTEYIKRRAKNTDAIVVCNDRMKARYIGCGVDATIFTPFELSYEKFRGRESFNNYETIYIDEPVSVFMHLNKNRIYDVFTSADIDQTFVFLGM